LRRQVEALLAQDASGAKILDRARAILTDTEGDTNCSEFRGTRQATKYWGAVVVRYVNKFLGAALYYNRL